MPEEERAAGSGVQEPASLSSGPEEEPSRVGGAVEGEGNPASAPLAGESRVADGPASRMRASRHALKACQLSAEIQAVLAVMRQSGSKWSQNVPALVEETVPEDPLVYDLKTLRKDVLTWTPEQWDSLPPITYLAPFLHVISTAKTNTVVTAVALSSLQKILSLDYFDERSYGAAEAMHQIVAALTSCHFEIVDAASEEAVLLRILQVLRICAALVPGSSSSPGRLRCGWISQGQLSQSPCPGLTQKNGHPPGRPAPAKRSRLRTHGNGNAAVCRCW